MKEQRLLGWIWNSDGYLCMCVNVNVVYQLPSLAWLSACMLSSSYSEKMEIEIQGEWNNLRLVDSGKGTLLRLRFRYTCNLSNSCPSVYFNTEYILYKYTDPYFRRTCYDWELMYSVDERLF
jgi:hypothetical protein